MEALYFDGSGIRVIERPEPAAEPGTAVVRMRLAGVCNTDLEIARGYMGFQGGSARWGLGRASRGHPSGKGAGS